MRQGTVKMFNAERGFGFIVPQDGGNDIFFHKNEVDYKEQNSLKQGDNVTFENGENRGKPCAIKVKMN
ncbi:cold-shock protein [Francisella sp. SYW-9]|uniref:cold-shock protein n=1 Tax=Francisella sp. SYW-9 TaxID=2610888 RepID=UPI00123CEB4D|nr:cold shock domain-containing protein [Francisella sp. SYW-9]